MGVDDASGEPGDDRRADDAHEPSTHDDVRLALGDGFQQVLVPDVPVVSGDPLGVVFDEDAGDPGLPRPVQRGTGAVGDDGDDVHTVPEIVDHRLQQRSRAGREDDDT